jgi:acyl-CoA hydrolase
MGDNKKIPVFSIYTEVIQESVIKLMNEGRVNFASGCSLTVSHEILQDIYSRLHFFKDKINTNRWKINFLNFSHVYKIYSK